MKYLVTMFAVTLLVACTTSPPTVQTGDDAEITFDGLHRVNNSRFQHVWVKPGISLAGYNKILPVNSGIQYRKVKSSSASFRANTGKSEFPLDEKQKAMLEELVREVFSKELGNSKYFTQATEVGPDVLELKGALIDVVSAIPPTPIGRNDLFISEIGTATLVIELRDSQSEEILARVVHGRVIQAAVMQRSSLASNKAEVRREFTRWGKMLTESLDQLHEAQ